jgi:NitT/TauT family transport system substrate-binding protein
MISSKFTRAAMGVMRLALCSAVFAVGGCGGSGSSANSNTAKIAYIGLTCEAPLFVAHEKGFFKEEGLESELVKVDWASMRESLASGKTDATHTLVTYVLKPIEQGLDLRMTGGVHTGCLRVQSGLKSDIKTIADLKGKRIGVQTMGAPPFLFTSRVLADHGMDPEKDVVWRVMPAAEMELALEQGELDAVANSEPIGSLLLAHEKVRTVVDQATDAPYKDEYCCAVVVNGELVRSNPDKAAKITRAILKATKWVSVNPTAAAEISVDKKWLAVSKDLDALALSKLEYRPAVTGAAQNISQIAQALKTGKILKEETDAAELSKRAWTSLPGVTDEWVNGLTVERVAGGGKFVPADPRLIMLSSLPSCCVKIE